MTAEQLRDWLENLIKDDKVTSISVTDWKEFGDRTRPMCLPIFTVVKTNLADMAKAELYKTQAKVLNATY